MIRWLYITATLLLVSGCASANWTVSDTQREVTWQVVNALDAATTAQIQYEPGVIEKQPLTRAILGDEPRTGDTVVYFGSLALSHYLISRCLPSRYRKWFQVGSIGYSSAMVINNCKWGLCE